ncbi:MAG: tRNA pseudouridine(55) synthase TruB [Burkholderiaceae bacterium]
MASDKWRDIDGVLLLDKPAGLSSNDALQTARRIFRARKGGHGGTLDPLATGLLPIAFGQATKFINDLVEARKTYLATIQLGSSSTTGDEEGEITANDPDNVVSRLVESDVLAALASLTGEIDQLPPMYSALKHKGKPLYAYARKGHEVQRTARRISVYQMELTGLALVKSSQIQVRIICSKGTYIRVLAEDIGAKLGCGAYLKFLRREAVGQFDMADGVELDELKQLVVNDASLLANIKPVDTMLVGLPGCEIPADQAERFRHGQAVAIAHARFLSPVEPKSRAESGCGLPKERCRVYALNRFLGLADIDNDMLAPRRLVVADLPDETNTSA